MELEHPGRHYLDLPSFDCPSDAPYVASNGTKIYTTAGWSGTKAKIQASASDGTGWQDGFDQASVAARHTDNWVSAGNDYRVMTGWLEGTWRYNSVWAPLFSDGHFGLSVTCTSSSSPSDVAWVLNHRPPWGSDVPGELLFPWAKDVM
jgi:hypothetical protein